MKPVEPTTQQNQDKKKKKRSCPFIRSPLKDCYCIDMNSNKISMAIYYCRNRYEECDIYKRITKPKQKKLAGLSPSEKRRS
jgi:hypothetical protein